MIKTIEKIEHYCHADGNICNLEARDCSMCITVHQTVKRFYPDAIEE